MPILLVPDVEGLTKQTAQRLEVIQNMEELGSGFYLAMHDLEIRGAGEVLGDSQSGNMMEVGFQLYNDMLAEAVRALKSGKEPDLLSPSSMFGSNTDINLHAPALLPDSLLRRRACAPEPVQAPGHHGFARQDRNHAGRDRRPLWQAATQTQALFDTHKLRVMAKPYGVIKIDAAPGVINVTFRPNPPVEPMRIIELVQKNKHIKLAGNDKLRIEKS